jgi:benzodiazapine receptor
VRASILFATGVVTLSGMSRAGEWVGALPFGAMTGAAALWGGSATRKGLDREYERLEKSPLQPPGWAFGPVWTALYALMSWSAFRVWRNKDARGRGVALGLWGAQLAANAAWTPLFFARKRRGWALVDLLALLGLLSAYTATAARVDRTAARLVWPYLGWTAFAGYLNADILRRNR